MIANEETDARPGRAAFGDHLKRLRIDADLTQEELAERAGVSSRLISKIERGTDHQPRPRSLLSIADGLELDETDKQLFISLARGRRGSQRPSTTRNSNPVPTLPATSDSFVGRKSDLDMATRLLLNPEVRLLTLTGPGGVGKSRLSIAIASASSQAFPDGTYLVELASVRDAEFVLPTIGQALGVEPTEGLTPQQSIGAALLEKRALLVVDNVEHVAAAASEIADLLEQCGSLRILATSRAVLNIRGEQVYRVEPLCLPNKDHLSPLEVLERVPSVELLLHRGVAADPSFRLTDDNAPAIAEIARRVDGLPLAIELAAARFKCPGPG